jgi:hypothetical protein
LNRQVFLLPIQTFDACYKRCEEPSAVTLNEGPQGLKKKEKDKRMKTIAITFVFTVTALAVASTTHIYRYGVRTAPSQIQMGTVPMPCGLPGLPPCPWAAEQTAQNPSAVADTHVF